MKMEKVKKEVKCIHCDKGFKYKYDLNRHIELVHEKSTKFECKFCGKIISNAGNLKIHIESVHEDIKKIYL